jgi:hypothetical protein
MDLHKEDIDLSVYAPQILTKDARTVDAKSVAFEIWKNRKDPDFVSKFVEILRLVHMNSCDYYRT